MKDETYIKRSINFKKILKMIKFKYFSYL